MKYLQLFENYDGFYELPKTLYHSTPIANLENVLQNGLLSTKSVSGTKGVYLTDDEFTAENYMNMRDGDGVVLLIDTSYLDTTLLAPDDYELQDYLDEIYEDDEYTDCYDVPWQLSLQWCNQVVYEGDIPPQAITVLRQASDIY